MNKEEQILVNRLVDLANVAYHRNIPMFSDFLNLNEQSIYKNELSKMPPVSCKALGGYNLAERKLAAFIPEEMDTSLYSPIISLVIKPLNMKFAEELNHRDFLGAIMNLGIERCKIGDIILNDKCAYVFCINKMAQYIIDNLTRVKHTPVLCELHDFKEDVNINFEEITGSVSSIRLDSIVALCYASTRSSIISNIEEGKVYVNGKIITTNSYNLKDNDIISVRGLGKFQYIGKSGMTKKGRTVIKINKYI